MSQLASPSMLLAGNRSRRLGKRVALGLLLLLVSAGGWSIYFYFINDKGLSAVVARIDRTDPGWRLWELETARPAVADQENAAAVVLTAKALIPKGWLTPAVGQGPGLAEAIQQLAPTVQLSDSQVLELRAALAQAEPAVSESRKLADMPRGRYVIVWSPDAIGTLLPHLEAVRGIARVLSLDAVLQAQDGHLHAALASCKAAVNVGRSVGDEPCAISQFVRMASTEMGMRGMARALAQGTPSAPDLEDLQRLLEDEERQPLLLIAVRAQRAIMNQVLEVMTSRRFNRRSYGIRNPYLVPDTAINVVDSVIARSSHATYLDYLSEYVEIAKLPPEQVNAHLPQLQKPKAELPSILAALIKWDDDPKTAKRFLRNLAMLRCAIVGLAVERYRQEQQHWPNKLADLVPKFITQVPSDPFDGAPVRFRQLDDGAVIYTLNEEGKDNGGNLHSAGNNSGSKAPAFRLWDVGSRRQPAPKPSSGAHVPQIDKR